MEDDDWSRAELSAESNELDHRDIAARFESLGGYGHGPEFAVFQKNAAWEPEGLLAWADLAADFLIGALESRFDGVGLPENTIVFTPDLSDEWWTKDKRYWMAMRSSIKSKEVNVEQATLKITQRLQFLRQKLICDLEAGEKIFVFKTTEQNPPVTEADRLRSAIAAYGGATLLYVRYADENHPPGTVVMPRPGLLLGYLDSSYSSPGNGSPKRSNRLWSSLCQQAIRLDRTKTFDKITSLEVTMSDSLSLRPRKSRRGRRIVLIGNCQMEAMAGLYTRFVAGRTGDTVHHVVSYEDLTDENRSAIQRADVVVEQLFDLKQRADTDAVATNIPRLFIPMVTAAFLWPFAGTPHPKNTGYPFLTGGPYGGEAADSYLNRLILNGTDPETAVETYANLDVNDRVNLDRLYELIVDRQRLRDETTGYRIADLIEQYFRSEQIFLSPYHPNVRIATALASRFFEDLGAERDEIERMRECTLITPFPKSELPFHPSVCRHFGLEFVQPDRRYRFMNEGLFTFREYALRYMRYQWNESLEEGIHNLQTGKLNEARECLSTAVLRSPLSAAGHDALSHVFSRQGARGDAIASARRAVDIEPDAASYRANLGNLLRQAGHHGEALVELRAAVAVNPVEPHYRVLLVHQLRQLGHVDEACDVIKATIRLDPYSADLQAEYAACLEAQGDLAGAVTTLQAAAVTDCDNHALQYRLAELLGRLDRIEEAVEAVRVAVSLAPDSARARILLSDLLLRKGDRAEALNEARAATIIEPASAHAHGHLGHVLHVTGALADSEIELRRAVALDQSNAHFRYEMSSVLQRQDRLEEAITAAREAAELVQSGHAGTG